METSTVMSEMSPDWLLAVTNEVTSRRRRQPPSMMDEGARVFVYVCECWEGVIVV